MPALPELPAQPALPELPAQPALPELPAQPGKFFWFLPTNGDSRSIVGASHASSHHTVPANYRAPTRRYLAEVARAADRLGYEGVLTPTGTWCEDAWLTASALLAETERLKFLVAFRPGLVPPTLAAQQTATLQRFSEGRVLLNIVTGGDDVEQRRFGDWLDHDERYARTGEFLHIVNSVWRQDSLDFAGKFYTVNDARVSAPPDPLPEIYFGGSSAAALPSPPNTSTSISRGVSRLRQRPPRSNGYANSPRNAAARCASVFGCTPSAATPPRRLGGSPTNCWPNSHPSRSPNRLSCMLTRSPRANAG